MSTPPLARGVFVTGTDTEIGKTTASAALLRWAAGRGLRAAGHKPVAAGTVQREGRVGNEDVWALQAAGSVALDEHEVGPLQFQAACAPHVAARLEGLRIERAGVLSRIQALQPRLDLLVVEGVGGFCVPLDTGWDSADLAVDLGLPVLLVVGLRLGCLNHALLSAEAVRARGLKLAGWIGNELSPDMPWLEDNLATLRDLLMQRHLAPCLGVLPWLPPGRPQDLAAHLDERGLCTALKLPA